MHAGKVGDEHAETYLRLRAEAELRRAGAELRRLDAAKHQMFYEIVLNGAFAPKGMGRWDDVLTHADAEAIHAYIVDEAWKAFEAQQQPKTAASVSGAAAAAPPHP